MLISLLKKFFKRNNSYQGLVTFNQNIEIPKREDITDNNELILIEKYKQDYKNRLSKLKYLTSLDINSKTLKKNIEMNIELLLNIFIDEEEIKKITLEDKVNYLVNIRKLDLYSLTILDLEKEVITRLIALKEIYQERKTYMIWFKKEAMANEINNLTFALTIIGNNKLAIELEKKRYLTQAIYMVKEEENANLEQAINKKRRFLQNIINYLMTDENIIIREDEKHILIDMADVERRLEIYAYQHKGNVDKLKEDLKLLWEGTIDYSNKENLLKIIKDLEIKYLVFYKYGKKNIVLEDLKTLYLIKFNILVLSNNGIRKTIVDENTNDIELECYSNIIMREIEDLLKGEGELNSEEAIKIILNILKRNKDKIIAEDILTNKYLFNICLAMKSKTELINMLKNFKVKRKYYQPPNFGDKLSLIWEDELSLETIYRIELALNNGNDVKLYEILKDDIYPDEEYYYLPEGLKEINYYPDFVPKSKIAFYFGEENVIKKIEKLANNKTVVFPNSFVKIKGSAKLFVKIKSLEISKNIIFDELKDFKILERTKNKIVCHLRSTNEIITCDREAFIKNKWGNDVALGLLKFNPDKNLYIEQYMKKTDDNESKTKLLEISYADVSTKYGDFCLHIEKNYYGKSYKSPYLTLSLCYGHHNEEIYKLANNIDYSDFCLFQTRIVPFADCERWDFGSFKKRWFREFRSILNRDSIYNNAKYISSALYTFESNGNYGVIFMNAKMKLPEKYILTALLLLEEYAYEYEKEDWDSKAYIGNGNEMLFLLKKDKNVRVIHKEYIDGVWTKKEFEPIYGENLKFTRKDFEQILVNIENYSLSDDLKKYVIDELNTFLNLHNENLTEIKSILKGYEYNDLLNKYFKGNIALNVERLIEDIMNNFHISIEELIGSKEKLEQLNSLQLTRKLKKD